MRTYMQLIPSLFAILILEGCAGFQGYPEKPGKIDGLDNSLQTRDPWYYERLEQYKKAVDKTTERNIIIETRMAEIDIVYQDFEASLYQGNVKANVFTEWAVLTLTASAAAVSGESTKTTLAALAAILVGGKAAYDKNALFERTMPALIAQMRARRNQIKANIFKRLRFDHKKYGLYMAKADLDDYYIAGSIPGAIADLTANAGAAMKDSEEQLSKVISLSFKDTDTSKRVSDWINVNKNNRAALKQWLKENGINISPTLFANSEFNEDEALRTKAIKDLSIN